MFRSVSAHEVHDLIQGINKNKSIIGIPIECIKLASDYISEALALVFNSSFTQGIMPDILKMSKVTPVDKGGERFDPTNYRPISTLPSISLIFEKFVCKQLLSFVEKHKILNECQFSFRKGHSTEHAIAEITDNLKNSTDNNLITCGVILDFSKAFDTVNHAILLQRLEEYGVRGLPLKWFDSYLSNRKQYVSLQNAKSSEQTITCGVPQGSSLGPLLFLIYINDISNSSEKPSFRLFADDTNIFASSKKLKDLEDTVNQELALVKRWCDVNKLSINMKKTNFMIIKSAQKRIISPVNIIMPNNEG